MKKLTAGIFATLLAVVSTGAANAEIASKGYVDQQVDTVEATVAGKADSKTVTALDARVKTAEGEIDALQTTTGQHTTQIGTINTTLAGKVDDADIADMQVKANLTTSTGWNTDKTSETKYPSNAAVDAAITAATTDIATDTEVSALGKRVETLETASATHATKTELTGGLAAKANTADLGDLATLDAVGSAQITDGAVATADIADKAVTEAKLSDTVNASLDRADSALQQADLAEYQTKDEADAAYAVKALEGQVGSVSAENMGTTATTVVTAIKEVAGEAAAAASAASAADTKAGQAQTAATKAQGEVDALEGVVNNAETGLAAAHTAIDALESGKLDKTGTAARATADASGNEITKTYATKAEIADMATDENLALKQDKTDEGLATTSKTVVGAINEVKTQADKGVSDAATAKSAADAAQKTANAAIPAPTDACADSTNKCVLVSSGAGNYSWEVIARDGEGK